MTNVKHTILKVKSRCLRAIRDKTRLSDRIRFYRLLYLHIPNSRAVVIIAVKESKKAIRLAKMQAIKEVNLD